MKNSIDGIGNKTCDLLACSIVPKLNAPPHGPPENMAESFLVFFFFFKVYVQDRNIVH
jgi:hypothetical protein